jgi:hypothetical protein
MPKQTCLQRRAGVRARRGNGLTNQVLNRVILRVPTPLCLAERLAEKDKRLRPLSLSLCMSGEP